MIAFDFMLAGILIKPTHKLAIFKLGSQFVLASLQLLLAECLIRRLWKEGFGVFNLFSCQC